MYRQELQEKLGKLDEGAEEKSVVRYNYLGLYFKRSLGFLRIYVAFLEQKILK